MYVTLPSLSVPSATTSLDWIINQFRLEMRRIKDNKDNKMQTRYCQLHNQLGAWIACPRKNKVIRVMLPAR